MDEKQDILKQLKSLLGELRAAVGVESKVVMGVKITRLVAGDALTIITAIEKLLMRFGELENPIVDEFDTLVASFCPESQKILQVYAPRQLRDATVEVGDEL